MGVEWCQHACKIRYRTRSEAQKHIGGSKRRTGFDRPLTTYRCDGCGDWHLTKITHFKTTRRKNKKGKK